MTAADTSDSSSSGLDYERLYEYRFRGIDQQAREVVWKEIACFAHEQLGRPRRVLDPAAGRGEFINNAPAGERWAVDRVAYSAGTHDPGVTVIVADIFDAPLPRGYFGGVWVSNFLEHLPTPDTVAAFLARMADSMERGGRIAVMGPNFRYCADAYFDCADHTLILSDLSVAEHLHAAGFKPLRVVPRFLPFSFRGRLPASAALTRGYLRAPFAWPLLGKQFLVVAEL